MTLSELIEKYPYPEYEFDLVLDTIVVFHNGEEVDSEPDAEWLITEALQHYEEDSNGNRYLVTGWQTLSYMFGGDLEKALGELHKGLQL